MELHLDAAHTALLRELVERTWRNLRYDIILRGIRSKQTLDHERALRTILERLGGEASDRSAAGSPPLMPMRGPPARRP
jgi:hypothetical protein